jgi:hypothetical protein
VAADDDEGLTPWGVREGGYQVIVWAKDGERAVALAREWLDWVEKAGIPSGEPPEPEQLGPPRSWRDVATLWETDEPHAWEAARARAKQMRRLLGVKGWWLAIRDE